MSIADNKRSVFNTIGSYTSLNEQKEPAKQNDTLSSINNKDDSTSFILDVMKVVAGTTAIKLAIGQMFSGLVKEIEPKLKTVLKKQFTQANANQEFSSTFKTNGVTTSVKSVDSKNKLKVNPNSSTGSLIYGSPSTSFDGTAYDAIQNSGNFENYNNIMSIKYIESSDSFQIKPDLSTGNKNIGEYFNTFIDDTEILNEKEIISSVMDGVYGTLANTENKTTEQIYNELVLEQSLKQVLEGNDSFEISPADNEKLLNKAREMAEGIINYDMGCGLLPASLNFDKFSELVSNISGSTDPYYIGNQLESTIDESSSSPETSTENKETIKDGFFQLMINTFILKITEAVTSAPQILVLFAMMDALQGGTGVLSNNPTDTIKNFKICIKCLSKEIKTFIAAFLFSLAVSYLIKLLKPIIKKVIKEKINQYIDVLKSLIPVKV